MAIQLLPGAKLWGEQIGELAPADVVRRYEDGYAGVWSDPDAKNALWAKVEADGGTRSAATAGHAFEGSAAGKLVATWLHVEKVFPGCWPASAQTRGDCFPAGTMVSMADGTTKPIESVQVGESVLSHTGVPRLVTSTIKKPFAGDLVKIRAKGVPHSVSATPDHRFISVNDGEYFWCPIELLGIGDNVSIPRRDAPSRLIECDLAECPAAIVYGKEGRHIRPSSPSVIRWHGSNSECKRLVYMDTQLAWLIGLYLAEGSCDEGPRGPKRITFNLNKNEALVAETAAAYIEDIFGVKARITSVPSKPSVLYVRVNCGPIAWLFKQFAPGNTYTKRVNRQLMAASKSIRLSLLQGWFTGDGSLHTARRTEDTRKRWHHFRAVAVSVSHGLVEDMFDLANSCGLFASVSFRKPRGASKAACNLHLSGANAAAVYPSRVGECRIDLSRSRRASKSGMVKPIASVERVPFAGDVYCLEVEHEHSFIANGYAVHNCVSHSTRNAALTTLACEIAAGKPDEVTGKVEGVPDLPDEGRRDGVLSTEAIYWWRDHGGDGWSCDHAASVVLKESGMWLRKPYDQFGVDLTRYSGNTAGKWGARNPPDEIKQFGIQHAIRTATEIDTGDQVRDFLANGYGISSCGGEGWSSSRDENGFSRRQGSWSHALAYIGYDDRDEIKQKYGEPLVCILNSWGKWNSGGRRVLGTSIDIPEGAYWAKWSDAKRRYAIAFSSAMGWPAQSLPDLEPEGF